MSKKNYKSRKGKYFLGWFPKEEFLNLSEEERVEYREYRRYHRFIYEGEQNIEKWKKEISKLKKKIKDTEDKINGEWYETPLGKKEKGEGWKKKMLMGYSYFGKKTKDYEFYCSVELRKRKSKTLINQQKGVRGMRKLHNTSDVWGDEGNRNNPSLGWLEYQKNKKEGEIKYDEKGKVWEMYYIRVESMDRGIWRRSLYVGKKDEVYNILNVYSSISGVKVDWKKISEKKLRDNLRDLYKGYVRYQIYKNGVKCITKSVEGDDTTQHPTNKIIDWMKMVGGEGIYEWLDE